MGISLRISRVSQVSALASTLCCGGSRALSDPPPGTEAAAPASSAQSAAPSVPAGNFFSTLKQAINQDYDHEVVRGHFDVGDAPDQRRYFCLVDVKTGKREANGVGGKPFLRPDGMTGVKSAAVSFYSCTNAEQQGALVTTGYVLLGAAVGTVASTPPPMPPTPAPAPKPAGNTPAAAAAGATAGNIDVAGVRLGMSPDQVRTALKSKGLLDYFELAETLGDLDATQGAGGRFINIIAAWTPESDSAESYEVMFTPVPGKEQAMAIVHSIAYPADSEVRETAVQSGLMTKYGGYAGSHELPNSPTWRTESGGKVSVGDPCKRRGIVGGLGELIPKVGSRQNLALKTTLEEFRFQIENCGIAIVTEDHSVVNADAPRPSRLIGRFTVTAYSPAIGFDGAAAAAQLMRASAAPGRRTGASRTKNQPVPDL